MLKLEGVSKTFYPGTVNEKRALNKVTLHLAPGDFATVVGSNGAGKSTLFNAICGVFYADEGSIVLGGEDVTFKPEYRRSREIGRLFQDPMKGTAPHMTIEENLSLAYLRTAKNQHAFFARVGKKDRAFFREQLAVLNMGLEDRMSQPVGLLSGGQRQALTLMMATMVPPKLLLLDEHTAALDPATAEKVLDITRRVVQQHKITTLMVTHNMKNALELGNRTLMMDSGRIVLDISGERREKMTVTDRFRYLYPDVTGAYSWWSYRFHARQNNAGWRIDYFIVSDRLRDKIRRAEILSDVEGSDHCPVLLDIELD